MALRHKGETKELDMAPNLHNRLRLAEQRYANARSVRATAETEVRRVDRLKDSDPRFIAAHDAWDVARLVEESSAQEVKEILDEINAQYAAHGTFLDNTPGTRTQGAK